MPLEDQLQAIDDQVVEARTVEFNDRRVTNRSVAELLQARDYLRRSSGTRTRSKLTTVVGEKGL